MTPDSTPDPLPKGLEKALEGVVPLERVWFFKETGSTNALAKNMVARGAPDRTLLVTDFQTRGRGRLDRTWESPPGANLMFSLIQRPDLELTQAFSLTLAAALSMARAVERLTGLEPLLKWPNDIFLDGRKLAGVLTELKAEKSRVAWAVVGVGLNVSAHPPGLKAIDLAARLGRAVDRFALLAEFLVEMDRRAGALPEELRREWTELSYTLGRRVTVDDQGRRVTGKAVSLEPDGALVIETGKGLERVRCGDLVVEGG